MKNFIIIGSLTEGVITYSNVTDTIVLENVLEDFSNEKQRVISLSLKNKGSRFYYHAPVISTEALDLQKRNIKFKFEIDLIIRSSDNGEDYKARLTFNKARILNINIPINNYKIYDEFKDCSIIIECIDKYDFDILEKVSQ